MVACGVAQGRGRDLLTVDEVAALLGISVRSVWRLVSSGKMPRPVKLSRSCRWKKAEIIEWVDRGCESIKNADTSRSSK